MNYANGQNGALPPIPGIATRTEENAQEVRDSLNIQQKDNVQGLGYIAGSPATPSVSATMDAPTSMQIDQMIADLLQLPYIQNDADIHPNDRYGDCSVGGAGPEITYLGPGNGSGYNESGNASGCGVMIIESGVTINGLPIVLPGHDPSGTEDLTECYRRCVWRSLGIRPASKQSRRLCAAPVLPRRFLGG